jgi:hypothetical protein
MRMKEHESELEPVEVFETPIQETVLPRQNDQRKTLAKDFALLCWKTDMLNREIAEFLQIPERRLYRYLSGTSKVPAPIVKLLTLKVEGKIA